MEKSAYQHYLPQLDGLRFVVILWAIIEHSPIRPPNVYLNNLIDYAWVPIDMIYVMGSFLFTRLLIIEMQNNMRISILKFYARRVLRIFPLYICYIAAIFLWYMPHNFNDSYTILRAIGLLTFSDNLLNATYGKFNSIPFTPHLHTISFLIQMYLLLPFVFLYLHKITAKQRMIFCIGICVLAAFFRTTLVWHEVNRLTIPMILLFRPEVMIAGIMLAFQCSESFKLNISINAAYIIRFLSILAIGLILYFMIFGYSAKVIYRQIYLFPLVAIATSTILWSTVKSSNFIYNILKSSFFVFIGKRILGLYIFHYLCISIAIYLLRTLGWDLRNHYIDSFITMILSLTLSILCASFSYLTLERIFLLIKEKYSVVPSRPI